jgi:hypothetical protein
MKFKVGDRVKVVKIIGTPSYEVLIGEEGFISKVTKHERWAYAVEFEKELKPHKTKIYAFETKELERIEC